MRPRSNPSISLWVGSRPPPFDARDSQRRAGERLAVPHDVWQQSETSIDIGQFDDFTFGGEWLFHATWRHYFDGGLGVASYQKTTVPVIDIYNINATTNSPNIAADLKLRIVPFSATVRFLPIGHHAMGSRTSAQASTSITGATVKRASSSITATSRSALARRLSAAISSRAPSSAVAGQLDRSSLAACACLWARRNLALKSGIREAFADLPAGHQGFAGTRKIDLSGMNYLFTLNLRFLAFRGQDIFVPPSSVS